MVFCPTHPHTKENGWITPLPPKKMQPNGFFFIFIHKKKKNLQFVYNFNQNADSLNKNGLLENLNKDSAKFLFHKKIRIYIVYEYSNACRWTL